jgi:hypothetical protein
VLCEAGWRRALEGWGKRRFLGCVSNSEDSKEWSNAELRDESDEEDGQESEPGLLASSISAMGNQQGDHRDSDRGNCDPVQRALWLESVHRGWRKYSKSRGQRGRWERGRDTTGGVFWNLSSGGGIR